MKLRFAALMLGLSLFILLPEICSALDYFGSIEKNRLVLKLDIEKQTALTNTPAIEFPCYIILHRGYPILTKEPIIEAENMRDIDGTIGKLDIVHLVELPPIKDRKPDESTQDFLKRMQHKMKRTEYLYFEFAKGGWNKDKYVSYIKIPYSVDAEDEKQMLKIAGEGTAEIRWRDPKSEAVAVVSYWSGMAPPFPVKVTVVESSLGFGNKLGVNK